MSARLYSPLATARSPGEERLPWTRSPTSARSRDQELKDLIQQLTEEEVDISYRRRILHGKIDILRAELVNRLRKKHEGGEDVITGDDVQRLTDILAGRAGGERARRRRLARRVERWRCHCPECGFVNADGANYCQKCGALPRRAGAARRRRADDGDLPRRRDGRAHPGRPRGASSRQRRRARRSAPAAAASGESFPLDGERMTIGRRPGLRRLPRRRDRLARPRAARAPRRRLVPRRPRVAQRHLRQPPAHRVPAARRRRRAAGRQVQADVPLSADGRGGTDRAEPPDARRERSRRAEVDDDRRRLQGAGAGVPGHLDLEDPLPRGPEAARRRGARPAATGSTRRPTSQRLRTILRLQRDEFLPLRVIRQELASGRADEAAAPRRGRPTARRRAARRAGRRVSVRGARRAVLAGRRRRGDARRRRAWSPSSRSTASSRASSARAASTTTRPSARSSARSPSWRATASAGATCACSAPRPTARPRCCSRSSPRRCARATPSGARRRRGAGEPRRGHDAPQAPAARSATCARSSAERRAAADLRGADPRHPRLPQAGDRLQGHHAAAGRRRGAATPPSRGLADYARPLDVDLVIARRGARLPARRRRWRASSAPASCLARKPGKLPRETVRAEYLLEYGVDALELHTDAVGPGARVLVHDDLLGHRRHGAGAVRARRAARRRGRRPALPDRAGVPGRPRAARAATRSTRCCATTRSRRVPTAANGRRWSPPRRRWCGDGRRSAPALALVAAGGTRRGRQRQRVHARCCARRGREVRADLRMVAVKREPPASPGR